MGDRLVGLTNKYNVQRIDGRPVGKCIVLEYEDDPNTYPAILAFAESVEADGYRALADDLRKIIYNTICWRICSLCNVPIASSQCNHMETIVDKHGNHRVVMSEQQHEKLLSKIDELSLHNAV